MNLKERALRGEAIRKKQRSINVHAFPYQVCNQIAKWFSEVMLEKEKFTFDQPCDGCGSYTIYAIVNYDGIIMAEFIRNSSIARGDYTHEIGTKGLESPAAMIQAMRKYYVGEGVSEIHPEYSRNEIEVVV